MRSRSIKDLSATLGCGVGPIQHNNKWFHLVLLLVVLTLSETSGFVIPVNNLSRQHEQLTSLAAKKKKKNAGMTFDNRVAYRNYEIVEKIEAGISLLGTEVKSIRDGKLNLRDGYVRTSYDGRSCVLHNVHIGKYSGSGAYFNHEELRPRPLLVHKAQALKWAQQVDRSGMTIVPIKAYFNEDSLFKVQIALCKGKNVRDKRETIKQRDEKRETSRIIKSFRL
mmetsp:Transcript_22048/g.28539  ORF Transcript_22048/g.28539 Transcript_22048/m.28539 type:complete len:223 (+) Transcript_22048:121-789(+)